CGCYRPGACPRFLAQETPIPGRCPLIRCCTAFRLEASTPEEEYLPKCDCSFAYWCSFPFLLSGWTACRVENFLKLVLLPQERETLPDLFLFRTLAVYSDTLRSPTAYRSTHCQAPTALGWEGCSTRESR